MKNKVHKRILKGVAFLLVLCGVLCNLNTEGTVLYDLSNIINSAEAADERYVFMQPDGGTNNIVEPKSIVELRTPTMELYVGKVDKDGTPIAFSERVYVEMTCGNDTVVALEDNNNLSKKIRRVGPGYAQVTAIVHDVDAGVVTPITCLVHVGLQVITSDATHWQIVDMTANKKILILEQGVDSDYPLSLKYIDNTALPTATLTWSFSNDNILSIGNDGVIHVLGAGCTEVSIKTDTVAGVSGNGEEVKFIVLVKPKGGATQDASPFPSYSNSVTFSTSESHFTLHTNAISAASLVWKVFSIDALGNEKEINKKDESRFKYAVSADTGNVEFTEVKAGTYIIRAYASENYDASWNMVEFRVTVSLTLADKTITMNAGDTYSIEGNSNIPKGMFSTLYDADLSPSTGIIASIDSNGIITANNEGIATIILKYRSGSSQGIFDPSFGALPSAVTYTIKVIDGIKITNSSVNMLVGATYQLRAEVSNPAAVVSWSSSDPSLATVDESGLVTAKKRTGTNTPVIIKASQTIDGVVKSVTCKVYIQESVTKVTVNPNTAELELGEFKTITATLTPNGLSNISLKWLSSDETVFTIADYSDLSCVIKGVGGGTAVLSAINKDNIVVGYCTVYVNQPAVGLSISEPTVSVLYRANTTYQLYATVTPVNTSNKELVWSSSVPTVATVDENGRVTVKKAGVTTIIVQSKDNPALIATCTFTVLRSVSGISLDEQLVEMYVGETHRVSYTITPSDASNLVVKWTSLNTSVVTVDGTGLLSAKGTGTSQIMVMTADGNKWATATVTVKQKATGVRLSLTSLTMNKGEYYDLDYTVTPATASERTLTWTSLDPKIVTVSMTGRITGRSAGTAVVMVKTESGSTSYCTVTVIEPVRSIDINPSEITIDVGESYTLEPDFNPINVTNTAVNWYTSDDKVAKISGSGKVTGLAGGTVVITCETVDGGYKGFCMVTVVEPVIDLRIDPSYYDIGIGKSFRLKAVVSNHDTATDLGVTWYSSDDSIVSVDDNGKITGLDYGYATITAEADDESGETATCLVRVVKEVTGIRLDKSTLTVVQGEREQIKATISPEDATYTEANFESDDLSIAIVDEDGYVTGIKPGVVWVHANAKDNSGKTALCYVTVIAPVAATGVVVSDKEIIMITGETKTVNATLKPATSTDDKTWSSNNDAIATVTKDGIIKALQPGTATITVMTKSGKTAIVNVTVLGLSRDRLEMPVYTQYSRLSVDGANGKIRWDVEDGTICDVANGVVIARKVGTTVVSATINGRKLECVVTVVGNK